MVGVVVAFLVMCVCVCVVWGFKSIVGRGCDQVVVVVYMGGM